MSMQTILLTAMMLALEIGVNPLSKDQTEAEMV